MIQVYLISYSHRGGFGRFFNYRADGQPPSEDDILIMERKLAYDHGPVVTISISRIADQESQPS